MLSEITNLVNKYCAASCRTPKQLTMTYSMYKKLCLWTLETGYEVDPMLQQTPKDVFPTEILGMRIVLVEQGDMGVSGNASDDFQIYLSKEEK